MNIILRSKILKAKYLILLRATNAALNAKINEVKNKIASVTSLATTTSLMLLKIECLTLVIQEIDPEVKDIKDKYFTTSDFNKFTNNLIDAKTTAKKLVNESGLNEKIKTQRQIMKYKHQEQKQN